MSHPFLSGLALPLLGTRPCVSSSSLLSSTSPRVSVIHLSIGQLLHQTCFTKLEVLQMSWYSFTFTHEIYLDFQCKRNKYVTLNTDDIVSLIFTVIISWHLRFYIITPNNRHIVHETSQIKIYTHIRINPYQHRTSISHLEQRNKTHQNSPRGDKQVNQQANKIWAIPPRKTLRN